MVKNIIFDFDGVILDSVPIKTEAFRKLFKDFPNDKVEQLIEYHKLNGGLSRYAKIKYFFEVLLNKEICEKDIAKFAERYSKLTKEELSNSKYLIDDTVEFIKKNYKSYNMHIASGADEKDLKYICGKLDLNKYFLSINGSPCIKSSIVEKIIKFNNYNHKETILIGDSINDYEAASNNGIVFFGYNNSKLIDGFNYISNVNNLKEKFDEY